MRVQLVANLAENGELVLAEHSDSYEAPAEVSGIGMSVAMESGNDIIIEKRKSKFIADYMI